MAKLKDITGNRYGRLTAIRPDHINRYGRWSWEFSCDCGMSKIIASNAVISGNTKSCGCHRIDSAKHKRLSHGQSETDTYQCWLNMRRRCSKQSDKSWPSYGGRGIKVCENWKNSFESFLADMGPKPEGKTLERINNNGDYEKSNCRWASREEQAQNKQSTVLISHNGLALPLATWARRIGMSPEALRRRHLRGEMPPRLLRPPEKKYVSR